MTDNGKLDINRLGKGVLSALWALLLMCPLLIPLIKGDDTFSIVVVLSTAMVCMMAVFIMFPHIKEFIDIRNYKIEYLILLVILGGSFLFNGLYFRVMGYIAIGLTFMVIVPVLNMVFSKAKKYNIFHSIAVGTVATYIIYYIFCLLSGPPISQVQYGALLGNSNLVGNFMSIVAPSVLFLILNCRRTYAKGLLIFLYGTVLSVGFFSNSRTAMIGIVGQLCFVILVYLIRGIKKHEKIQVASLIKKIIVSVLLVTIAFGTNFFLLTTVKKQIAKALPDIQIYKQQWYIERSINKVDGEEVTFEESLGLAADRFEKGLYDNSNDAFTSGRRGIWQAYLKNIGFMGHAEESMNIKSGDRMYIGTNAHNYYLQVAYSAGIIAGIALIALILLAIKDLLVAFIGLLKHGKMSNYMVYFVCIAIPFMFTSLTSGGYMLYTYFVPTFFWLMIYVVTTKGDKHKENI
jgi:hypothetical protein